MHVDPCEIVSSSGCTAHAAQAQADLLRLPAQDWKSWGNVGIKDEGRVRASLLQKGTKCVWRVRSDWQRVKGWCLRSLFMGG